MRCWLTLWHRLPFLGRLLITATFALLSASSLMLFVSAREDARTSREEMRTELDAELKTLPAAIAEVVVIGDFSTLQQTLEHYVFLPRLHRIAFIDSSGIRVEATDAGSPPRSPAWFRRLLDFHDVSGETNVVVGQRVYGRLSLTLSATETADRSWDRLLEHWGILTLAVVLDFVGIWIVLRSGLTPLSDLKRGAEALAAGRMDERLPPSDIPEMRTVVVAFNRMADALALRTSELVRFSEITAHHLQEPSRRLVTFSRRLKNRLEGRLDDEDALLSLSFIDSEATRLRTLLHNVELYLAAGHPLGPVERQDTAKVAEKVAGNYRRQLAEIGASIEIASLPAILLDARRLEEVFAICVDNAIRYRRPETPLHIRISGEYLEEGVRLRIRDNGSGIPPEYRTQVFRVFEQLRPAAEPTSTGIGLSILRHIAQSTGGSVCIEDGMDGGVAVVVDLRTGLLP